MTDTKELVEHLRYRAKHQTANDPLKMLIAAADAIERLERETKFGGSYRDASAEAETHKRRAEAAEAEAATLRARVAKMEEALEQCKEYLASSLGSTSEINPYPAIEAALNEAQPRW